MIIRSNRITNFGDWSNFVVCDLATSQFGIGFNQKVLSNQGTTKDDLAITDFAIRCNSTSITPSKSDLGLYSQTTKLCPEGNALVGFSMKQQPLIAGDNTATNGVRMYCDDDVETEISYTNNGIWGTWGLRIYCPTGYVICGFRGQYDSSTAPDRTGLDNIDFLCCPFLMRVY